MTDLIKIRQHLHQYPEVSDYEKETAKYVIDILNKTGKWKIKKKIGGYGILAEYKSENKGPHIAFRADLDALPIEETGDVPYKSKHQGVAHLCGHDGHMTILLGLAERIQQHNILKGKVSLVFQPSEENGQGAERMMNDKAFKQFKPDYFYAIHNLPGIKTHQIVCKKGVIAAASIGLKLTIKGVGGHAGNPERSTSPFSVLRSFIKQVPKYLIDSKKGTFEIVSIVHIKAGELSFGVIPSNAVFAATLRASDDKTLEEMKQDVAKQVKKIAKTHKVNYDIEWLQWFPAVVNEEKSFDMLHSVIDKQQLDFEEPVSPFRWSEDFGLFSSKHPTTLIGIGAGENHPPLHHSNYDFPDEIMEGVIELYLNLMKEVGVM